MTNQIFLDFQQRIKDLYVVHPEVKRIWNIFDERRRLRKGSRKAPQSLFIMGKSRVGKSQIMERYAYSVPRYTELSEDGTETDIIPVAYIDCPSPFTIAELYSEIIQKGLNASLMGAKKIGELKTRAYKLLKQQKVEMLIIDEINFILSSRYVTKTEAMEQLKDIANKAGVIVVCVGTPDIGQLRKLNEQYVVRYPSINIRWFKEYDESFVDLLRQIEEQLNAPIPLGFSDTKSAMPEFIHHLCGGLIGWLDLMLYEAFKIVGALDENFNDFSILRKIDGDVLYQARKNVIGELSDEEINKFLER
ncbi:TniB family NTP-binding protein [Peribacillus frigoritolerans]|uniref:TniB family NTP-binding protein n=1 Tax=Peribacillus frigoritolerans TaxID=450367 RepID=UPI0037FF3B55